MRRDVRRGSGCSSTRLFAQFRAHVVVPASSVSVFLSSPSQWVQGPPLSSSPSHARHPSPSLLTSQCLSHGEEIGMFLPFTPAHSYLSKDQLFPTRGPQPSWWPQGLVRRAPTSLPASPWGRDFGSAMMWWWGLVLLRVSTLPSLCDCGRVY